MGYKGLIDGIKKNDLKNIYIFLGQEVFLIDFCIEKIKEKYIDPNFETLNYITIDGKDINAVEAINAAETLPFMSEKKLVVINDPSWFSKQAKIEETKDLLSYLDKPSTSTILIFNIKRSSIDKRKKIVKTIKKQGGIIEFDKIRGSELEKWVEKEFKKKNKTIDKKSIDRFIDITGYLSSNSEITLYDMKNEIEKTVNYIGEEQRIKEEDIEKVLIKSLQSNIFELVDAIAEKRFNKAISIFNIMILNNEPPQLIIHMITRQFRLLLMSKVLQLKGYSVIELSKKMKVPNFVAKKILTQSKNFSMDTLKGNLETCINTDKSIKKGKIDAKLGIEILIMNMNKQ
ncbi:DNA polymerase III subunit delta [Senegalia massiliensis]|jgi:DNA polymerase-3 subunit delta|uniref:DNA polymerase III subunit delta n=1 Tax=Senegalia massiliensis TaxID=1720316 RepID=UPI00102FE473|nr:DNA polymerase III subunit delta [Senegalia massiliensis]